MNGTVVITLAISTTKFVLPRMFNEILLNFWLVICWTVLTKHNDSLPKIE